MAGRTERTTVSSASFRRFRVDIVSGPDAGAAIVGEQDVITVGTATGNDLILTDSKVSGYHLELRRTEIGIGVVDLGSTNGTHVQAVRIERGLAGKDSELRLGDTTLRLSDADKSAIELHGEDALHGVLGRSQVMRRLMARVAKVASSDVSCLVLGETGTGKEVVAHAIHQASARAERPLEVVDCGTLVPSLIATELFGHEKGAFTGADQTHVGAFERADGGTVFLDEIGELPPKLQATLLGVIERRSFKRVGGSTPIAVDVRVLAATHRDLRRRVNAGEFRQDLYYRLAVVLLEVPALRDRLEDLPLLAQRFLRDAGDARLLKDVVLPSAMKSMFQYDWPGNVRELRNVVESAMVMGEIPSALLTADGRSTPGEQLSSLDQDGLLDLDYRAARARLLEHFERSFLERIMERADRNITNAAKLARMNRSYLLELLKRHGLK